MCLAKCPKDRPTLEEVLLHPWLHPEEDRKAGNEKKRKRKERRDAESSTGRERKRKRLLEERQDSGESLKALSLQPRCPLPVLPKGPLPVLPEGLVPVLPRGPLDRMLNIKTVHFPKKKSLSYKTQPIPGTLLQSLPLMRLARSRITQTTFKSWLISHRASLSTHKDFPQGLRG